jgi:copper chaperone CopZ
MICRHRVRTVSAAVGDHAGVSTVEVDLGTRTVRVGGGTTPDAVRAALAAVGYPAQP